MSKKVFLAFFVAFAPVYVAMVLILGFKATAWATLIAGGIFLWTYCVFRLFLKD